MGLLGVALLLTASPTLAKKRKDRSLTGTVVLPIEGNTGRPSWKMGWSVDDATYLRSIPRDARRVRIFTVTLNDEHRFRPPFRPISGLPAIQAKDVARFNSYEAMPGAKHWVPRKIWVDRVGDYEQWWLQDAKGFLAVISIHVDTGRTWFFGVRGTAGNPRKGATYVDGDHVGLVATGNDHCYGCHPSGLRKILPRKDDPHVDWKVVRKLNRRIAKRGLARFGKERDPAFFGSTVPKCRKCHNGKKRGGLYPIHIQPIHYKLHETRSMPPKRPLGKDEATALLRWIGERSDRWYRERCNRADANACKLLGVHYADGTGGLGKDPAKALPLLLKACQRREGVACVRGARLIIERKGARSPAQTAMLKRFLRFGCALKQDGACSYLKSHPKLAR